MSAVVPRSFHVENYPWLSGWGGVFAREISAAPERMCAGRARLRMKRGRAVSGNKNKFATWLDDSSELGRAGELIFARFFPKEVRNGWVEVRSGGDSGKPADSTAQLLSILRELVGSILEAQLDVRTYDVYLIAYDLGVTRGLCGGNSAVASGMRKGLADAIHISPEVVSRRIVGKSIGLGRRHGMLVRQLIDLRSPCLPRD